MKSLFWPNSDLFYTLNKRDRKALGLIFPQDYDDYIGSQIYSVHVKLLATYDSSIGGYMQYHSHSSKIVSYPVPWRFILECIDYEPGEHKIEIFFDEEYSHDNHFPALFCQKERAASFAKNLTKDHSSYTYNEVIESWITKTLKQSRK